MSDSYFNLSQSATTPANMVASYANAKNPMASEKHITLAGGSNNIGRN